MKNILCWGIEDQTHFSTSWHARVSFTRNDLIQSVLGLNLSTPISSPLQGCTEILPNCMQNNQLLTKALVRLDD